MSHTPGPWTATLDSCDNDHAIFAHNKLVATTTGTNLLDIVDAETDTANAQLIAAAPELEECLRDLVLDMDQMGKSTSAKKRAEKLLYELGAL